MRYISVILASLTLTACGTTSGPKPIINAGGPIGNATSGLAGKFITAHNASNLNGSDPDLAAVFARTGLSLIYANCNDFFLSAGQDQKWIVFSRDAVGALGTLAAGVLALHSEKTTSAGTVALVTSTAFAGLDIYTKNFLFAAENISAVQELTSRALSVHAGAVLESGIEDYASASQALIDNQKICSPMYIAALAREAIKKGNVTPSVDANQSLDNISNIQDQAVLERLGGILNPPSPLSPNQAGGLWWLLKEASTIEERKKFILPNLAGIPDAKIPIDQSGNLKDGYNTAPIAAELSKFSAKTKASFKNSISTTRAEVKAAITPPAAAPSTSGAVAAPGIPAKPVAPPSFSLPVTENTSKHISISVQ